jgi:DNA-binding transcriptional LysR family regulator
MQLTLRHLRYFMASADRGQITLAAAELNVSQSSVTCAVRELEEILGVPLFDRRSNGIELTMDGSRFIHHARDILRAVADAETSARSRTASVSGPLHVWVSYTVAGYFLPPLLNRFTINCPNVEVKLVEAERPEIERALSDGRADVAVMLISNRRTEGLATQSLVSSPRRLWLGSNHPLLTRPRVSFQEIAAERYILLGVDESEATTLAYWRRAHAVPNIFFKTNALEAVRSMVAGGLGVTILADTVYRPWSLEGRRIETRDVVETVPSLDIGLAWNPERRPSPAADSFRAFITTTSRGEEHRR